jgi:hypothetical protein
MPIRESIEEVLKLHVLSLDDVRVFGLVIHVGLVLVGSAGAAVLLILQLVEPHGRAGYRPAQPHPLSQRDVAFRFREIVDHRGVLKQPASLLFREAREQRRRSSGICRHALKLADQRAPPGIQDEKVVRRWKGWSLFGIFRGGAARIPLSSPRSGEGDHAEHGGGVCPGWSGRA